MLRRCASSVVPWASFASLSSTYSRSYDIAAPTTTTAASSPTTTVSSAKSSTTIAQLSPWAQCRNVATANEHDDDPASAGRSSKTTKPNNKKDLSTTMSSSSTSSRKSTSKKSQEKSASRKGGGGGGGGATLMAEAAAADGETGSADNAPVIAHLYGTDAYKSIIKPLPIPRTFKPTERSKLLPTYRSMNMVQCHPGIAGGFLTGRSTLMNALHIAPTDVQMGWWRCGACDHQYRRRVFDQFFSYEGQCPGCGAVPKVDAKYAQILVKFLTRVGKNNLFASKATKDSNQNVPFLQNATRNYSPMLAAQWSDHGLKATKGPDDIVYCSNKLDGVRCIVAYDSKAQQLHFFSRTGTIIEACDHLEPLLRPLFERDPQLVLDGELYTHKGFKDFQEIIGAVRTSRERRTPEIQHLQEQLQYHVFDIMYSDPAVSGLRPDAGYAERVAYLERVVPETEDAMTGKKSGISGRKGSKSDSGSNNNNNNSTNASARATSNSDTHITASDRRLFVVPGVPIRADQVEAAMHKAMDNGYEGVMIRLGHGLYQHGRRSTALMKHKRMYDSEYEIVHAVEGKGKFSGGVGAFICRTERGKQFAANPAVTEELRREMWRHRSKYIGQVGTVQYQELTRDGIPRFPVLKCVRGAKDGSNWL